MEFGVCLPIYQEEPELLLSFALLNAFPTPKNVNAMKRKRQ